MLPLVRITPRCMLPTPIGGLIFATVATLVFVLVVFGMVDSRQQRLAAISPQASTGDAP